MNLILQGDDGGWAGFGKYEPGIDKPLKPCPWCKSEDINVANTHTPYYEAGCQCCGATGPDALIPGAGERITSKARAQEMHEKAFAAAIDAWNGEGEYDFKEEDDAPC